MRCRRLVSGLAWNRSDLFAESACEVSKASLLNHSFIQEIWQIRGFMIIDCPRIVNEPFKPFK